jgi:hypothetical protein
MISTSSTNTSQVIFTNFLTNSELYNFPTNGTVQKILSHPDNTVEDLTNIRYLVGDGELNYYGHNTHIYGPLNDVGAFCFLDSKYNFSWAQNSTIGFHSSSQQINLGSYIPSEMVYGDGVLYTVGK